MVNLGVIHKYRKKLVIIVFALMLILFVQSNMGVQEFLGLGVPIIQVLVLLAVVLGFLFLMKKRRRRR